MGRKPGVGLLEEKICGGFKVESVVEKDGGSRQVRMKAQVGFEVESTWEKSRGCGCWKKRYMVGSRFSLRGWEENRRCSCWRRGYVVDRGWNT